MKNTGIIRDLDSMYRITLPFEIREGLGFNGKDTVEYFLKGNMLIIRKFGNDKRCCITGEITDKNIELFKGLVLSPLGMEIILKELKNQNW